MQFFVFVSPIVLTAYFGTALVVILAAFLRTNELPSRLVRWGLFGATALFVIRGVVYSIGQYQAFQSGFLRFLSQQELLIYSIQYSLLHYFSIMFLSAFVGGILLSAFWVLQRRSQGRWLDTNECLLVTFGALAAGWPGAILYAVGVILLPLVVTPWLLQTSENRSPDSRERVSPDGRRRVRLAPFIIISALLAMAVTPFVLPYTPWLQALVCRTCM